MSPAPPENDDIPSVAAGLRAVRDAIGSAAREAGRDPAEVTLVAISKTHPAERIRDALAAGQRVFGENRVQEAESKYPALRAEHPDLKLHLVGPLPGEMASSDRRPACYIQVNTGEEPQKAGVLPQEADALIGLAREELGLPVEGLMCIPPFDDPPSNHFALLAEIARRNGLAHLSMGMSGDFEQAIRSGATHVRVGTAIFGPRRPRGETTD
jgi:uncharacterized pyridoxal phosphate-containing UPF0001 family protein